jgi:hypothetical protein
MLSWEQPYDFNKNINDKFLLFLNVFEILIHKTRILIVFFTQTNAKTIFQNITFNHTYFSFIEYKFILTTNPPIPKKVLQFSYT